MAIVKGTTSYAEPALARGTPQLTSTCLCGKPKSKTAQRCKACAHNLGEFRSNVRSAVAAATAGRPVYLRVDDLHENWELAASFSLKVLIRALLSAQDQELEILPNDIGDELDGEDFDDLR